jgi:hypothetical protein
VIAWGAGLAAELAVRLGDPAAAERWFATALAAAPGDGYLLGARADFLLDAGRAAEVLPLLAGQTHADGLLLRLALAERRLPDLGDAAAAHVATLRDRFDASRARGDRIHMREEARFELHLAGRPQAALRLAIDNWAVQREIADARILLEAALASGQPDAARPVLDWMAATRIEEPHLRDLAAALGAAEAHGG